MNRERFSPVLGPAKEGNYRGTKLALAGWMGCAFYGTSTYTCNSPELISHEEAAKAQQQIAKDILSCFEGTWAEASEQMGPDFVVLHPEAWASVHHPQPRSNRRWISSRAVDLVFASVEINGRCPNHCVQSF